MAINSSIIDERHNVVLNCTTIKPIFKKIWWSWLNIGLVYFFEYAILVGFADVLTRQSNIPLNPNFFQKNVPTFMYSGLQNPLFHVSDRSDHLTLLNVLLQD